MGKKGISPLIATVLIIGFTVALAALIITWGGQFIRQTQETVGTESDLQILCSQVKFDITGVTCGGGEGAGDIDGIDVVSQGNQEIQNFVVRVTAGDGTVEVDDDGALLLPPLVRFGAGKMNKGSLNELDHTIAKVTLVELIARIQDDAGNSISCEAGIEEFRPLTGDCGNT